MNKIDGGIVAAKGFSVGAVAAKIKKTKLDMMVLTSDYPSCVAGVFTTNVVKAAPVVWDQNIVKGKKPVRSLVVNSGNANACTAEQGEKDTKQMASLTASLLDFEPTEVLVCSTGVIGVPLPMEKIENGIKECVSKLDSRDEASSEAAQAICTTDTFIKEIAVEIEIANTKVVIGGIAKGSGMIHPNMATMLSFITTDANIDNDYFQALLEKSCADSYNMISVDGDTSTNDTVLAFANGASKSITITTGCEDEALFVEAFNYVNTALAKLIVQDGEGATKFIEVVVKGATSKEDARTLARSVTSSNLVKTAFFGADANWGRVLCAMGYSQVCFDPSKVSLTYMSNRGLIVVVEKGKPLSFNEELAKSILEEREIILHIDLFQGDESATAWGCDLSYEYVRINGEYRS